jgi:hypothetical protein
MLHRRNTTTYFSLALVLLCAGYGTVQARELIRGPVLTVYSPQAQETVTQNLVSVTGRAENSVEMELNGKPLPTDPDGYFSDTLATPEGITTIRVSARDRFGRTTEQDITFVGVPVEVLASETE